MQQTLIELLQFIIRFTDERGYPPTFRDCINGTRATSTSVVSYRLDELESLNFIERDTSHARAIRLKSRWLPYQMRDVCDEGEFVIGTKNLGEFPDWQTIQFNGKEFIDVDKEIFYPRLFMRMK